MSLFGNKNLSDFDRMKALRNTGSYAVLLLALGAMTFFGVCNPNNGGVSLSGAAASVAGERIEGMEFRRYYNYYLRTLGSSQENFDAAQFGLADKLLEMFINNRVSFILSDDNGFVVSDDQIHDALLENPQFEGKDGKFSAENFKNFLKANGYSEATYLEEQRRAMSVQEMESTVGTTYYVSEQDAKWDYMLSETKFDVSYVRLQGNKVKVPVSKEEIDKYLADEKSLKKAEEFYNTNKSDYESPEERKARHVLVAFKGARNATGDAAKRSKEDALKRAQDILKKAQAKNANFEEIAKKDTDEPSGKTSGGDLGWFDRKKMVKEFSDAAFALKKGELSGVIESPFGYHVIKVEGAKAAKKTDFAEAKTDIARKLLENEKRNAYVAGLAKEMGEKLKDEKSFDQFLKANDLSWEKTGEFAANANYLPGLGGDQRIRDEVLGFKNKGDTSAEPIKVGENYFVLRLASITKPDMSKLAGDRLDELQLFGGMRTARQIFSGVKEAKIEKLKEEKRIWKNPDYLALDRPRNNS